MENTIGRGALRLTSANGQTTRDLGFIIQKNQFQFFALETETNYPGLFEAIGAIGNGFQTTGYVILDQWSASPADAFFPVSLDITTLAQGNEEFTLRVSSQNAFGRAIHTEFSGLQLAFHFKTGEGLTLAAGSQMQLHFEGVSVPLTAQLHAQNGLQFLANNSTDIPLDQLGKLTANGLLIEVPYHRWNNIQAIFGFGEGAGNKVHDISHSGMPIVLEAEAYPGSGRGNNHHNPAPNPEWVPGGLKLNDTFFLESAPNPAHLISAIRASNAMTVEVWIKAQTGAQDGPAQIMAIRRDRDKNWFTLSQGAKGSANQFLQTQLRLDHHDHHGNNNDDVLTTPANSLPSGLAHIVFTHGTDAMDRLYINGELVVEGRNSGDFDDWSNSLQLVIGSDRKGDPKTDKWEGEIHQLAIYDRALTAEEIFRNHTPAFTMAGQFTLANVPAPLENTPFATTVHFNRESTILDTLGATQLPIRPHLAFNTVEMNLGKVGEAAWTFTGTYEAQIWDGIAVFNAKMEDNLLNLTTPADEVIALELAGLGEFYFTGLELAVQLDGNTPKWTFHSEEFDAFSAIPSLLVGEVAIDTDFKLLWPELGLDDGDVLLNGRWLGADRVLHTTEKAGNIHLNDTAQFSLPFSLDLPAIFDQNTGARIFDAVRIEGEQMHMTLAFELQPTGFLGILNANFEFTDATGTRQAITLPERRLYVPPVSQNTLLGDVLAQAASLAEGLLVEQGRHAADYFLTAGADQPQIFLSATNIQETTITTALPAIFGADQQVNSLNSIFSVAQTGTNCTLTLNLAGATPAGIRQDYDDLLVKAGSAGIVNAGAVQVLRRRIAERLPLNYSDLLYYFYGWDIENGWMDLQGGMRLRLDLQNYQFVQASDPTAHRGYVGSGSLYIPVNTYSIAESNGNHAQLLGFGPFLSQLQMNSSTDITNEGAGGLIDLMKDGNRKAFYRLFFPKQPSTGLGPERVVTLVGTDTWAEMLQVTADFNPDGNLLPAIGSSFFFRGKAMILPEIQVYVRNQAVYVPVGTTLRQLVEMYDDVPSAGLQGQNLAGFAGNARPLRLVHEGADSKAEYRYINFVNGNSVKGLDALDLPLVKGDRFYF